MKIAHNIRLNLTFVTSLLKQVNRGVMSKKPIILPTVEGDGLVSFSGSGLNVKRLYGLAPSAYLAISNDLVVKGLKIRYPDAKTQITFALYCHELLDMDFDLLPLLSEFNAAQNNDSSEVAHALSLAKLCFHYRKHNFHIQLNKARPNQPNPDLTIDTVACELKVRHDQLCRKMKRYQHLLHNGQDEEYNRLYFDSIRSMHGDLQAAIKNRAGEALEQSKCTILDLSDHFHTWNFHRLRNGMRAGSVTGFSETPLMPVPGAYVIFAPDNATDLRTNSFEPKALWGYIRETTDS